MSPCATTAPPRRHGADCSIAASTLSIGAELAHGADGFPRLSGRHQGREVRVDLSADTMTIRRLPQLWLSTTLLDRIAGLPGFAVLVRPAGTEFYSLTSRFEQRLETPAGFPAEVLIRGDDGAERAARTICADAMAPSSPIRASRRSPSPPRGLRIIRQAGEGKRGEHLLLRQCGVRGRRACRPTRPRRRVLDQPARPSRAVTGAHGAGARGMSGKRPLNPYIVLALAILAPGAGHVAIGAAATRLRLCLLLAAAGAALLAHDDAGHLLHRAFGGRPVRLGPVDPDAYRIARIRYEAVAAIGAESCLQGK